MTKQETIKILTDFNEWRLGAETPQPEPKLITQAIDTAIQLLIEQ